MWSSVAEKTTVHVDCGRLGNVVWKQLALAGEDHGDMAAWLSLY